MQTSEEGDDRRIQETVLSIAPGEEYEVNVIRWD